MGYMIGNYEVVEKLGSGSTGDVYKGRDPKTNQTVAIKVLSEELSNNPRAVERFKREVRQAIQLDHPNLITSYTAGEFKGRLYYVMEFVDGTTAKKYLLQKGASEESRTIEIMIQIAKALEYASGFGIIHRDIKPDNIMIASDGRAKLCDMGLAKSTDSETRLTVMGTVLGTPHYMSPEQGQGEEKLDTRTDIFSLGATSYQILTNCLPFEGSDPVAVMSALIEQPAPPMYERIPQLSDSICAVISKMMEKDRNKRYENFTKVLEDLYRIQKKEPTIAEQTGYAPQGRSCPATSQKFREAFVPPEEEVWWGMIALHNKLVTNEQMEQSLNRQESLALLGIHIHIDYVLIDNKIITVQQSTALDKALNQYILDRGDDIFGKYVLANGLLDQSGMNEYEKLKKDKIKGISGFLFTRGCIDEEKRQMIFSNMQHSIRAEESKAILKACLDNKLLSHFQAEKCSRIYSNNTVMGKYKDICSIIVEKNLLTWETCRVVLRAVRRNILTGRPVLDYIKEKALPIS